MQELKNIQHAIEDDKPKVIITFVKDGKPFRVGFDNAPINKETVLDEQVAWAMQEIIKWPMQ